MPATAQISQKKQKIAAQAAIAKADATAGCGKDEDIDWEDNVNLSSYSKEEFAVGMCLPAINVQAAAAEKL